MFRISHGIIATILLITTNALTEETKTGEIVFSPNYKWYRQPTTKAQDLFNDDQYKQQNRIILVSVRVNGKLVLQKEMPTEKWPDVVVVWDKIPVGECQIKIEGDGIQTIVKNGLTVTPTNPLRVLADVRRGTGVRVIEYGTTLDPETQPAANTPEQPKKPNPKVLAKS